jgi:hypothetical protein
MMYGGAIFERDLSTHLPLEASAGIFKVAAATRRI